jgi:hypothetical protein
MPRLIRIRTGALMEVLGSVERCSPDPRRNTSKEFFEASPSGDKAETCILIVSTLSPLLVVFVWEVDTKRRQGGDMSPLLEDLSSINCE